MRRQTFLEKGADKIFQLNNHLKCANRVIATIGFSTFYKESGELIDPIFFNKLSQTWKVIKFFLIFITFIKRLFLPKTILNAVSTFNLPMRC